MTRPFPDDSIERARRYSDEEKQELERQLASRAAAFVSGGSVHVYLSTSCWHARQTADRDEADRLHAFCQGDQRLFGGNKVPAKCKFCPAPCICECHKKRGRRR